MNAALTLLLVLANLASADLDSISGRPALVSPTYAWAQTAADARDTSAVNRSTPATAAGLASTGSPAAARLSAAPATPPVVRENLLFSLWQRGDLVIRSILLWLLAMLIASWYALVSRLWGQVVLARHMRTLQASFWTAPNLYEAVKQLEPESTFRAIAQAGLEAATHRDGRLTDRIDTSEWIAMSLERAVCSVSDRLRDRLGVLGTVASAAAFAGFFGTIWGLYAAFVRVTDSVGVAGLAPPVGEALLMSVLGLAVAFPAAAGRSWLVRRNSFLTEQVREFASEIRAVLLSGNRSIDNRKVDAAADAIP
jgi:biopolymer transport protein ExbB